MVQSNDGSKLVLSILIDATNGTVITQDPVTVLPASPIQVYGMDMTPIALSQIPAGHQVGIVGSRQADGSVLATIIYDGGLPPAGGETPPPPPTGDVGFGGQVKEVHPDRFVIEMYDQNGNPTGQNLNIYYDSGTQFFQNGQGANASMVVVNGFIGGRGVQQADGSIKANLIDMAGGGGDPNPPPTGDVGFGGKVLEVHPDRFVIEMYDQNGNPTGRNVSIYYDGGTEFFQNGQGANASMVVVNGFIGGSGAQQADGSIKANRIDMAPSGGGGGGPQPGEVFTIGGQVVEFSTGFIVTSWRNPDTGESGTDTLRYDPATTPVVDEAGNPAQIAVGSFVQAEIEIQSDGSPKIRKLMIGSGGGGPRPGEILTMGGQVVFFGADFIVTSWRDEQNGQSGIDTLRYDPASTPIVDEAGNPTQITVGSHVQADVEFQADGTMRIMRITVFRGGPRPGETFMRGGRVIELAKGMIITSWQNLETGESGVDTLNYDTASTQVVDENGNPTSIAVGNDVKAEVEIQADGTKKIIRITVYWSGPQPGETFIRGGQIIFVGQSFFVAQWQDQQSGQSGVDTVNFTADVPIVDQYGNPASLQVGKGAAAEVQIQPDRTPKVIKITVYVDGPEPGSRIRLGGQVTFVGPEFIVTHWEDQDSGRSGVDTLYLGEVQPKDEAGAPVIIQVGNFVSGEADVQADGKLKLVELTVHTGGGSKPGDREMFAGVITQIWADSIEIEIVEPDGSRDRGRGLINSNLVVKDEAGNTVQLKVGDFVTGEVEHTEDMPIVLSITVMSGPAPGMKRLFGGLVTQMWEDSLEVEATDTTGQTRRFTVHGYLAIQVVDEDGNPSAVSMGNRVRGELEIQPDGRRRVLSLVVLRPGPQPGQIIQVGGTVMQIWTDSVEVMHVDSSGQSRFWRAALDQNTVIRDQNDAAVSLKVGDVVMGEAEVLAGGKLKLVELTVHQDDGEPKPGDKEMFAGVITQIWADSIEVEVVEPDGSRDRGRGLINSNLVVKDEAGNTVQLKVGDYVEGEVEYMAAGLPKVLSITVRSGPPPGGKVQFGGLVTQIWQDSLEVEFADTTGQSRRLTVYGYLAVQIVDGEGKPSVVNIGKNVRGEFELQPDGRRRILNLVVLNTGPQPGQTFQVGGVVMQIWADSVEVLYSDSTGQNMTWRAVLDQNTVVRDQNNAAVTLRVGDHVTGEAEFLTTGKIRLRALTVDESGPVPGEVVEFPGRIKAINGGALTVEIMTPDAPVSEFPVLILQNTLLTYGVEFALTADNLTVGDEILVKGAVSQDAKSVEAAEIRLILGSFRSLAGLVAVITPAGFDFETRDRDNNPIILKVSLVQSTSILRQQSNQPLTRNDILRGMQVLVRGKVNSTNILTAQLVMVPMPLVRRFEGRVVSLGQGSFLVEAQAGDQAAATQLTVSHTSSTLWLVDTDGQITPGSVSDLAANSFLRGSGILIDNQNIRADSIWVLRTKAAAVNTFTILDGKRDGAKFTFRINLNEGTTLPPVYAVADLTVSTDFRYLSGKVSTPNEPDLQLAMNKLSGDEGKLAGKWSGVLDQNIMISTELFSSSGVVTGTVTRGGALEPGGQGPKAGDEITIKGQVSSLSGNSLVVTFTDQYNQQINRPVTLLPKTVFLNQNGDTLRAPVDSLRNKKVTVTGILQADLSLVAVKIVVEVAIGGGAVSTLPAISGGRWDPLARLFTFSLPANKFDEQATGNLTFSLTLSPNENELRGDGAGSGSTKVSLILNRMRVGEQPGPAGGWTGNASMVITGGSKIWPLFLDTRLQADNSVTGGYDLGEGRLKTEVILVQNKPPVFQPLQGIRAPEGQPVTVSVTATDPDNDALSLSAPGLPAGMTFVDNGGGRGTLNGILPKVPAGRETVTMMITFVATDAREAKTAVTFQVEIERVKNPPVLAAFPTPVELIEGKSGSFSIPGSDPDGDKLTYTITGLPAGASYLENVVSWLPPFGSAGSYTIQATAIDPSNGSASRSYTFNVKAVNRPPRFERILRIEGQAGQAVSFTVKATDPDLAEVLTFSVAQVNGVDVIPQGAVFVASSGAFNWTPSAQQVGPFKAAFVVTDKGGMKDVLTVDMFIGQMNLPPTLTVIDSTLVNQGALLTITANGVSPSNKKLDYYARELPRGASFDKTTSTLSWTPDYQQKGMFRVVFGVGDGSFKTEKEVGIRVNEVVLRATLKALANYTVAEGELLRFQVTGAYPDGRPVQFEPPTGLPAGASFDRLSGTFQFRPEYNQAGAYNLGFSSKDSDGQAHTVSNTVTVTNVNREPKLTGLKNIAVSVGQAVAFQVQGSDPDSELLTYTASNLPSGAVFNSTATPPSFGWTPPTAGSFSVTFTVRDPAGASDSRSISITVGDSINLPPSISPISDLTIGEGDTLRLTITTSDPENDPVTVFLNQVPENAIFDSRSGTFTFRPWFNQAGVYSLDFVASDGELTDREEVTITVVNVVRPPVISVPALWSVNEGDTLDFTVVATDVAGERIPVLSSSLPGGSILESSSGRFFWSPDYDQAGMYNVTFIAVDGQQVSTREIMIAVSDQNRPPSIFEIRDQQVAEGDMISFEISTSDPDGDAVTIAIDSTETPYIQSVEIRNNSIFVFNTALLSRNIQIPSAVFKITASDGRGGIHQRSIAFKIVRRDSVNVPIIPPGGDPFQYGFPGTGLGVRMRNTGILPVGGNITGSETSGELTRDRVTGVQMASSLDGNYGFLARSKDKVKVNSFLSADGATGGDFYGIRRGWGLDLSTGLSSGLTGLSFEITFTYHDEDIPGRDIPEFTESGISAFGLDASGNFIQLPTALDTVNNKATTTADLSRHSDYTLGIILDLQSPYITSVLQLTNTTDELGPYEVRAHVIDNVLVKNVKLYYAVQGGSFKSVPMTQVSGQLNLYSGKIPGQIEGSTVLYYVEASDSLHTITEPQTAPAGTYRFSVLMDGVSEVQAGDLDGNAKIDIFDLLGLLKVLSGTNPGGAASDVDGNGKTDIFDLLALLRQLAN